MATMRRQFEVTGGALVRALVVPLCLGLLGCSDGGNGAASEARDRAAIEATIRDYLPALAQAYASGDLEPLRQWAVERELAHLERRVVELGERGWTLEAELRQVTLESVDLWSHGNAYASTVEVWDLRYYTAGVHALISEQIGETHRARYQLTRDGDRWWILYRELERPAGG